MEVDIIKEKATKIHLDSASKVKTIGTHDGTFHCDEVLAVSMLKLLPQFKDAQIIRSRNEEVLKTCDIVVDVGGVFDPETLRFDHHQKSFQHTMTTLRPGKKTWSTRLSSAGLVYVYYGHEVLAQVLDKRVEDEVVTKLYEKIYGNFMEEIDAIDNGVPICDGPARYKITTNLSSRVGALNSSWRDPEMSDEAQMTSFSKAMDLVSQEFLQKVQYYASDWWEAYSLVASAVEDRFDVDETGQIIEFPGGGVPWKEHLRDIEETSNVKKIAFVLYPDPKGGMWRIQGVPVAPESFLLRVPLLKEWCGLRDKELEDVSGIPTITFVHANGFIGGARERDSVLKMARLSLAHAVNKEWDSN